DLLALSLWLSLKLNVPILAASLVTILLVAASGRGEPRWGVVLLAGAGAGGLVAGGALLGPSQLLLLTGFGAPATTFLSGLLQGGLYSGLLYMAWQAVRRGRPAVAVIPLAAV